MASRRCVEALPSLLLSVFNTNLVAPHYFKPADLEQLASGDKKMPKAVGASSTVPP